MIYFDNRQDLIEIDSSIEEIVEISVKAALDEIDYKDDRQDDRCAFFSNGR